MKAKIKYLGLIVFSLFLLLGTSCVTHQRTYHKKGMILTTRPQMKVPPGHLKKMTGAKSAKAYAPGHRKKHRR